MQFGKPSREILIIIMISMSVPVYITDRLRLSINDCLLDEPRDRGNHS